MRSAVSWPLGMALMPVIWAVPLYCAVQVPAMAVPAADTVTRMQCCPAGSPLTVRSIWVPVGVARSIACPLTLVAGLKAWKPGTSGRAEINALWAEGYSRMTVREAGNVKR